MGLDKPIHERYLLWLIEVLPVSSSCVDRDPTCETLRLDHIPGTSSWPIPTDIVPTSLNLKIWPPDVNLGYSYQFGVSVMSMIGNRIIPTLELTIVALVAATVIGTALGVFQALRQYSFLDYSFSVGALFGLSIPTFFFRPARPIYIRRHTRLVPVLRDARLFDNPNSISSTRLTSSITLII